ncbi:hypothetical protein NFJ02_24g56110 [Pycnococcus provasolii]
MALCSMGTHSLRRLRLVHCVATAQPRRRRRQVRLHRSSLCAMSLSRQRRRTCSSSLRHSEVTLFAYPSVATGATRDMPLLNSPRAARLPPRTPVRSRCTFTGALYLWNMPRRRRRRMPIFGATRRRRARTTKREHAFATRSKSARRSRAARQGRWRRHESAHTCRIRNNFVNLFFFLIIQSK